MSTSESPKPASDSPTVSWPVSMRTRMTPTATASARTRFDTNKATATTSRAN